jgi:hypothetical protein
VSLMQRLLHRGETQSQPSPFREIVERKLAFLEDDYAFEAPEWEPLPHAEEVVTYRQDRTLIRVHLGDSATGIDLELLTANGRLDHLQIADWLHRRGHPWAAETERIVDSYARLLKERIRDV